jgi:hypothetical protein
MPLNLIVDRDENVEMQKAKGFKWKCRNTNIKGTRWWKCRNINAKVDGDESIETQPQKAKGDVNVKAQMQK